MRYSIIVKIIKFEKFAESTQYAEMYSYYIFIKIRISVKITFFTLYQRCQIFSKIPTDEIIYHDEASFPEGEESI